MQILTRKPTYQSCNNTSYEYAATYALYDREEIVEWVNLHPNCKILQNWDSGIIVETDIQWRTDKKSTLEFQFKRETVNGFTLNRINSSNDWTYESRPFAKNMGLTLDELYEHYNKKYEKARQKFELNQKQVAEERKLNDIEVDEYEYYLIDLAERFNFTLETKYSSKTYIKNKTYRFYNKVGSITFEGFAVKSRGIQCWRVYFNSPNIKDTYSTYCGSYDEIKQLAEGYMIMFQSSVLHSSYEDFAV